MATFHSKRLESSTSPAENPSTGFLDNSAHTNDNIKCFLYTYRCKKTFFKPYRVKIINTPLKENCERNAHLVRYLKKNKNLKA